MDDDDPPAGSSHHLPGWRRGCMQVMCANAGSGGDKANKQIKQAEIRRTTHDDDGATPYELAGNGSDGTNDAGGKAKDEAVQAEG